ncbi:MAG: CPBP family intramembrane glutamic endopeptidase [Bacillota bacterium]
MARSVEAKAALILGGILAAEGAWVLINLLHNPVGFLRFLGFAPGRLGEPLGWLLAALVTAAFVYHGARLPSVRANLLRPSALKLLAMPMALTAGVLEEAIFRKLLMDYLATAGAGAVLQVLVSGLAFGAVHGIWGLFGRSWRAALGATLVTAALGAALAFVYLAAGRSVAACVTAHFLIDALMEPGLVLAALRGEMSRLR